MLFALLAAAAISGAVAQAPEGTSSDPFAPNGALGQAAQRAGNVTNGPAPKGCSKFEILAARGTGETGPFGLIVGDPLVAAVTKALPDSRGYAVQYPASFNMTYSPQIGMDDVINRLNNQNKACPDQKFALVGYSQGAGVMHAALGPSPGRELPLLSNRPKLDESVLPKILAVVMFGDPGFKGTESSLGRSSSIPFSASLEAKLRQNCGPGDPVCDPTGSGYENHLVYIDDPWQTDSVAFILAAFKGEPLPKAVKGPMDTEWLVLKAKGPPKDQREKACKLIKICG